MQTPKVGVSFTAFNVMDCELETLMAFIDAEFIAFVTLSSSSDLALAKSLFCVLTDTSSSIVMTAFNLRIEIIYY